MLVAQIVKAHDYLQNFCSSLLIFCKRKKKHTTQSHTHKKNSLPSNYERKIRRYLELKFIPETTLTVVNGANLAHQKFSEKIVLCELG
jgi:hypothetical protein